jgi:hypothetical protein
MATPFQDIYTIFLSKIKDYSLLSITNEELEENLWTWLSSGFVNFRKCKVDLYDCDLVTKQFNSTLSGEEKEIVARLMLVEYLTPHIVKDSLLNEKLNSKDYQTYSPANQIKEIRELRNMLTSEVQNMMILYTFTNGKIGEFK